jgi:sec-independent protein translocase protein TatA
MFGLGATELVIVLVVTLLLFGGTQLPKLARSLGQAQREFHRGTNTPAESEDTT